MTDTQQPRPAWWPTVEQEAATAGVDSDVLWRISGAESSHGVNNVNPLSSARGPFQITGDTWNGLAVNSPSLNLTDQTDPQQQARAAPWLLKSNNQVLRNALKRDPSPTEQFIGWHAGIGRAPDLIRAPADTPVGQLFSPAAVQQNPEVFAKVRTAGDYRAWAAEKMQEPDYRAPAPQQHQPAFDLTTVLAPGRDRTAVDGMQPDLRVRLADLFAAAPPAVRAGLSITSGYRSPERQAEIMSDKIGSVLGGDVKAKWEADVASKGAVAAGAAWATTLRDNGITKWVGLPGGSHHQKGDASDLGFGSDAARDWVHANAGRFGLSFPMAHEPWHIELSGARGGSGSGSSSGAPGTDGVSLLPNRPGGAMTWATAVPSSPFTDTERSRMEQQGRQGQWTTAQAAWEAARHENVVGWAMDAANTPRPDPNYSPTVDGLKQDPRLKGIDVSHYGYLMASRSQAEMDGRVDRLKDALAYEAKMGELGIKGAALRMGASVLDPAGWLLSVASPIGGAAKLGRAGRILAGALEGAAGNVAADIPRAIADPTYTRDQLLYTAAGGLAFGATAGAFLKPHAAIRQEVDDIARSSGEMVRQIDAAANAGSVGAARDLSYVEPARGDTMDFTDPAFVSRETGNVAFANARIDSAGRMKRDENPVIAATGGRMVEDAVGNADHSAVNRAVSVEAGLIQSRQSTFLVRGYRAAWEDYKARNGIGWFRAGEEESRFRAAVADWIDNPDPTAPVPDKAIVQAADAGREFFDRYHKLVTDPGSLDGSVMAPLKGVKELEADPRYFPRIWDFMAFGEGERALGSVGMRRLIRDSVLSAHPEMATADAERLAGGFYKGLQSVKAGQEVSVSRMVSGDDREGLRAFLRENTDMGEPDITRVLAQMEPGTETGSTARTKHRASMNVHYAADMMDHTAGEVRSVSLKDFLDRDFLRVSEMYNRQMSAQVALARLRIDNPRWRPGDGEEVPQFLVDGIRSDGDWDTLLKQARATGAEMGHHPEATEKGIARLQFTYDAIKGRLGATERGTLGTAIRIVKDYNFLRVMNQVGFAQAAETWNIMAQVGVKAAFSQMPTFRAIMRDARTGALNDDVMEQLEHMAAPGTDMLRGYAHLPVDDFGNVVRDSRLERLEGTLKRGTRLTSMLSGMAPITTYQQKWMAKAALARFAMDATGEKALNGKRMAVLGIGPEMAAKIRDQLQRHEGFIAGESGTKLRVLHLDRWEPDARHALEYAVHTWTRKAIQENDLGQMNSVLGSTVGKLMFQFRNFMFAAYTKQTLHAAHMRDWESLSMMLGTSFFGGLTYAARTYLASLGREDRTEFLERRLNAKALGAAAIQGGGWSSMFPMLADAGTYVLGFDPMFDTRVTGTPSRGITSNPTFDLLDNAMKASRGISGTLFRGDQFGQQDAQALRTVLPMGNFLPFLAVSNAMMAGLPRGDTHKHRD